MIGINHNTNSFRCQAIKISHKSAWSYIRLSSSLQPSRYYRLNFTAYYKLIYQMVLISTAPIIHKNCSKKVKVTESHSLTKKTKKLPPSLVSLTQNWFMYLLMFPKTKMLGFYKQQSHFSQILKKQKQNKDIIFYEKFQKTISFWVLLLGANHKRRLFREGGRGSPLKADLLHKPI